MNILVSSHWLFDATDAAPAGSLQMPFSQTQPFDLHSPPPVYELHVGPVVGGDGEGGLGLGGEGEGGLGGDGGLPVLTQNPLDHVHPD